MIIISSHTEKRAQERGIARDWIELTVTSPDWTTLDPQGAPVVRSYKTIPQFGGRYLRVVNRPNGDDTLIITAFWDRDARP